ncbi:MAG: hypothetical protein WC682_02495 [Parcubacteria group bacterium]|jgi:hypothetical protein
MKEIIVLAIIFLGTLFSGSNSFAKEIGLGEKIVIGGEGISLSIEYKEMKNKFCHLQIEYLKNGEVLLSDHIEFYAYQGEFNMKVEGTKLTFFHTEISGGTVIALLDGKEI